MILGATWLDWMPRLAAIATCIAALELLVVRRALSDDGVFAWPILRRDYAPGVRWLADLLFAYPSTIVLLVVQLGAGLALPIHPAAAWITFSTTLAISVRFRGSYNGGSDSMLLVVTLSLAVAGTWPQHARIAIGYCAAHLVLSYVLAGVAKLRDAAWRSGHALATLVELPQYRVPARIALLVKALTRPATWAILAFEVAFPIVFLDPIACVVMLAIGAAFHLANAITFGLNRFLWAWLAAYPALVYTLAS